MVAATVERLAVVQGFLGSEGVTNLEKGDIIVAVGQRRLGNDQLVFQLDGALANALLESALLHVRNLFEFFVHPGSRPDDMRPDDFADPWPPGPADAVESLEQMSELPHKHLAHLTWKRVDVGSPLWHLTVMAQDILSIAEAWSGHLRCHARYPELHETFAPYVANAWNAMQPSSELVYGS